MRMPPEGTVPRERPVGNPALTTGRVNGELVVDMPIDAQPAAAARGQKKYNIVCAQCHGVLGDGNSVVAENMALRLPPSPPGAVRASRPATSTPPSTRGYGVMPSSFTASWTPRSAGPWSPTCAPSQERRRGTRAGGEKPFPRRTDDCRGSASPAAPKADGAGLRASAPRACCSPRWASSWTAQATTHSYLIAFTYWVGISVASLIMLAIFHTAKAKWIDRAAPGDGDHGHRGPRLRGALHRHRAGAQVPVPVGAGLPAGQCVHRDRAATTWPTSSTAT